MTTQRVVITKRYDLVVAVPADEGGLPSSPHAVDATPLCDLIEQAVAMNGVVYDYNERPARWEEGDIPVHAALRREMSRRRGVPLTPSEISLLIEALDSHEYWQLSDADQRNDGYSRIEDGENEEIDACRALSARLSTYHRTEAQ